jgi:hypothetical protein
MRRGRCPGPAAEAAPSSSRQISTGTEGVPNGATYAMICKEGSAAGMAGFNRRPNFLAPGGAERATLRCLGVMTSLRALVSRDTRIASSAWPLDCGDHSIYEVGFPQQAFAMWPAPLSTSGRAASLADRPGYRFRHDWRRLGG